MDKISQLQAYLKDSPNDNFLKHALALENIKLGNEEIARDLFIEILTKSPDYVGSYYHLAKLYERLQLFNEAIDWYKKGIETAKKVNEKHALAELQMALDDVEDLLDI